ncbi:nucleobase:cation symporter-2 family protein [Nocardiopsis sp. Huas11]|uniref:nucleobase:cation symporter-2 family protein n=1 Tax=Nocardiopsis sp. Huas11 TaxID=2183912 RepID=UPI000EAEC07C|nr:nucleobase:cation symporter-2 family protein [Nocardiopsis sp. Huas11]
MTFLRGGRDAHPAPRTQDTPTAERPEDEKPPGRLMGLYGLQHILALYAGVIAPPLVVATAVGLDTVETGLIVSGALLVSGLATLLQTLGVWKFGAKVPLVIGASFVPVTAMTAIADDAGLPAVFGASVVAGLFGILVAPFVASLIRFFPPVVTGSVITVIGVTLMPVAVGWIAEDGNDGAPTGTALALAGATLAITLLLSRLLPGVWNRASILLGMVLGTLIAAAFGRVDFSAVAEGPMLSIARPFHFGAPEFQVTAIVTMCVVMLVILVEGVADILATSQVVGTKMDGRRLAAGLRADAATAVIGPLFNSFPGSTFSQNIGLIALNKVKSRYVVAVGALILVAMGLFPVLGRVAAMIPAPVLGGAGLVLFGSVAAAGIQTLGRVDYEGNHNLVIVAVALSLGVVSITAPGFFAVFPDWASTLLGSGIVTGTAAAVLLNVFFNVLGRSGDGSSTRAQERSDPAGPVPARD